jgi:hypothetical protein
MITYTEMQFHINEIYRYCNEIIDNLDGVKNINKKKDISAFLDRISECSINIQGCAEIVGLSIHEIFDINQRMVSKFKEIESDIDDMDE